MDTPKLNVDRRGSLSKTEQSLKADLDKLRLSLVRLSEVAMPARRTGDRVELAVLIRKNAEDLLLELCGKKYDRAYNPNCPSKKRGGRPKTSNR